MRVAEIIAGTKWLPGSAWLETAEGAAIKPRVSVLLPTFCRSASGYFERAVRAVLNQTLADIELIIIDDASIDGTAEDIATFMRLDPRVSCLRHPRNVGLPAVSEFEAFCKAQGEFIAFAFDDDELLPNSLEQLLGAALLLGAKIIHGHVDIIGIDATTNCPITVKQFGLSANIQEQSQLSSHNFFANSSVMLHRSLIEQIGFYDPNIAISRSCDWDLWCRAAEKYRVHAVDVAMGLVSGPMLKESLGRTYSAEYYLTHEWKGLDRNESLRQQNFLEIDVQDIPSELSATSKISLLEIHQNFRSKFWYEQKIIELRGRSAPVVVDETDLPLPDGYILVVAASFDATLILHIEHLRTKFRQRIRIVNGYLFEPTIQEEIAGAAVMILVRTLYGCLFWIEHARLLGVPHYYLLDDNLSELGKLPEYAALYGDYNARNMTELLASFSGVLLSTEPLIEYFNQHEIHPNLLLFPPIAKRPEIISQQNADGKSLNAEPFTVVFFGGGHRLNAFKQVVLPALIRLSKVSPFRLIVVGANVASLVASYDEIELVTLPRELAYDLALGELMQYRIDVLVHPGEENVNNKFKNLNVLINAHYLRAVPVLSRVEPFLHLQQGELSYLASGEDEWFLSLKRVLDESTIVSPGRAADRTASDALRGRLASFVETTYSGALNEKVLRAALERAAFSGLVMRDNRLREAFVRVKKELAAVSSALGALRLDAEAHEVMRETSDIVVAEPESARKAIASTQKKHQEGNLGARMFRACRRVLQIFANPFIDFFLGAPTFSTMPITWKNLLANRENGFVPVSAGSAVRKSANISGKTFIEFQLPSLGGHLTAIDLLVEVDTPGVGEIGIEVVDSSDEIALNQAKWIPVGELMQILRFEFAPVDLAKSTEWRFRVFCRGVDGSVVVPICRSRRILNPGWFVMANYEVKNAATCIRDN